MNLRDHDAPCVHGHWFSHVWVGDECPGGAAVSIEDTMELIVDETYEKPINREAARILAESIDGLPENAKMWHDLADAIVDAALGLTDA